VWGGCLDDRRPKRGSGIPMATAIAILSAVLILMCVPLVLFRPQWVFYVFLVTVVFDSIFNGYIEAAGYLGLPQSWRPADGLAWLTFLAAGVLRDGERARANLVAQSLMVVAVLSALALVVGFVRDFDSALSYSRVFYIVPAIIFGIRYLTSYDRFHQFMRFSILLLLAMFVLHLLIRFSLYTPPIVAHDSLGTQLRGERGGVSLVPLLYLVMLSMGTARLVSSTGSRFLTVAVLLSGILGLVLSENRSMYGSAAVLAVTTTLFIQGRFRILMIYSLAGAAVISLVVGIGFDPLARFRQRYHKGYLTAQSLVDRTRFQELSSIFESYASSEIAFLLTGRGIGAMHFLPGRHHEMFRAYYHCEYLGWLDRCGLVGLGAVLVMHASTAAITLRLTRSNLPHLRCLGVMGFLLIVTLAAEGLFHPTFSNPRAAALLVCFVVLAANWEKIHLSSCGTQLLGSARETFNKDAVKWQGRVGSAYS
ncbi:MAG: hypothetical protein ACUVWX_10255, partial [Kiritimatiellia bacterium]